jgi:hypothetical protein
MPQGVVKTPLSNAERQARWQAKRNRLASASEALIEIAALASAACLTDDDSAHSQLLERMRAEVGKLPADISGRLDGRIEDLT